MGKSSLFIYPPWTIHEADFALYLADVAGNAGAKVWLGGTLEDLSPELDFVKMRADIPGNAFANWIHIDEEHKFTVKNLWVMERATGLMPSVLRNQKYVFVVRWYDAGKMTWVKRTYSGAMAEGQRLALESEVYHQGVPFMASFMTETRGVGAKPDLTPVQQGLLRYVTAQGSVDLYSYDFGSGAYAALDAALLATCAEIVVTPTAWSIVFAGNVTALQATAAGLFVNELTAIGGTFAQGAQYPRLEWWVGPSRIACLTAAGELAVPDLAEVDADPGTSQEFLIKVNGAWVAGIAQGRAYALAFSEFLNP